MAESTAERPKGGFRCPACGFAVFNRRAPLCEGCLAPLPAEILLSPEQSARLDREMERLAAERQRLARRAERERELRERKRAQ